MTQNKLCMPRFKQVPAPNKQSFLYYDQGPISRSWLFQCIAIWIQHRNLLQGTSRSYQSKTIHVVYHYIGQLKLKAPQGKPDLDLVYWKHT